MTILTAPPTRGDFRAPTPHHPRGTTHARRVTSALLDDLDAGRPCPLQIDEATFDSVSDPGRPAAQGGSL